MSSQETKQKLKPITWIIVIALIILGVYYRNDIRSWVNGAEEQVTYHAIFLSNGQVYFGEMQENEDDFIKLENVYYLQVESVELQENTEEGGEAQPELQLIKLGEEVHGPKDEMVINVEHVIFYEELKEDSDIVATIKAAQK